MNRAECERPISDYLPGSKRACGSASWSPAARSPRPFWTGTTTRSRFTSKSGRRTLLTDDGYTIADLRSSGMAFNSEKRKAHLTAILNGFGVRQEGEELQVHAMPQDFAQKKHNLLQAMLSVNDMFVMGEEHVRSLFKEDVAAFLESNHIPVFRTSNSAVAADSITVRLRPAQDSTEAATGGPGHQPSYQGPGTFFCLRGGRRAAIRADPLQPLVSSMTRTIHPTQTILPPSGPTRCSPCFGPVRKRPCLC